MEGEKFSQNPANEEIFEISDTLYEKELLSLQPERVLSHLHPAACEDLDPASSKRHRCWNRGEGQQNNVVGKSDGLRGSDDRKLVSTAHRAHYT
ncbi:UNVERIFIED_CONTAM: hypothetical protein K2H54_005175 [Gekko kuhli]